MAENAGLILEILDLPDKEIAQKVNVALEMVGLPQSGDLFRPNFLGGERASKGSYRQSHGHEP